jgi:O-antigen ligase
MYIKKLIVNISEEKRYIQIIELLKSFTQNPFIGVGFGKGIPTNIANAEKPWKYEVTYVLYLYQTGILGISLFLGLFISLFNKLKKLDLESKALAMGLIGYLMASFTNAYLISGFDYQFPVIICLLYISGATYYRGQKSFKYEKE